MDRESVEKKMFLRDCEDNMSDARMPPISSVNPTTSGNVSFQARCKSVKNNLPIKLITLDNFKGETVPLKRKPGAKFKQINHRKHSCTDVHCLIIFICFVVAWVYVASYAFSRGNLNNVLIPTDSKNAKCGLDSGVRNKKMLFFFNLDKCLDLMTPITGCDTKQICVESCPQTSFVWQENKMVGKTDLLSIKENLICDAIVDKRKLKSLADIEKAIENEFCSGWYLKSQSIFNHCVWDFSENICNVLPKMLTGRKRRLDLASANFIDVTSFKTKLAEFVERTKSLCAKQNYGVTTNFASVKEKFEQSNSNLNRLIMAIISKFNHSGREILSEHIANDLKNSWKVIIFAFAIHLLSVLLFITLLRWIAAPLVWISICGVIIGLILSFVYSFQQYRFWSSEPHVPHHSTNVVAKVQNILETEELWFYLTIVLGILLTVILLIVFVIRKRIKIAVAIIKEASKAITNIKSSIFFPIFPGILYIFVLMLSIIIMLYLSSIGEFSFVMVRRGNNSTYGVTKEKCICAGPTPNPYNLGDTCNPELFEKFCHIENDVSKSCVETSCSFKDIEKSQKTQCFMLFNIFCFFWVTFFISAYQDMVLACTFSMWYWTFNKKNLSKLPLLKAIWITTCYHLGTLAFGSLILSICRIIKYILELIEKKVKMYNNTVTRAIMWFMKCFFWLLEKFLRFLNRNAFITCAIHSTNFCESSKKAFNLITQNLIRVYAVDKVSDFLFFLSKILITGCTSCITYYFLQTYPSIIPVYYPSVPVALVAITTYVMTCFVFSTYSMAVDTLFFCFLEDSTENDGSVESPFYMSNELNKLLGKAHTRINQLPN